MEQIISHFILYSIIFSTYSKLKGAKILDIHYIIESEIAVLFLSITLCVYLQVIYSGTSSDKKGLLRYCYMANISGIVDVLCSIILRENSGFSLRTQYFCNLLWQWTACGLYFMFMRYIAGFAPESESKRRMKYAQNIVFGIFIYLQIVGHFTGTNYAIAGDKITHGSLWSILTISYVWIWSVWTWCELYLYRRQFTRGQLWALFMNFFVCWLIQLAQANYFPAIPINFIVISVNVYYFFFLLETPAYRDLERTLERLRKAKELADEANELAVAADAAKGEFLANMSHEIRTPLTTILGMDEVILRKYESGPIYQYARDMQSAGNTLLHIINDILDFSKIESGQLELALRNYDLARVLRDVDNMVKIRAEQKGLQYITQIDE